MAYAILRVAKLKTTGAIGALGQHNERTRETRNADPERQWQNIRLVGSGDWLADAQERLADVEGHIRKNAVLGIEHVLAASPAWFARASEAQVEAWALRSLDWLQQTYGERNVVAAVLHGDERTPHIQALVVPLDERDHLNARHFIGGDRGRLAALQDSYAEAVREFGLERGVRGSVAEHQQVRDWYAKLETPVRAAQEVARAVQVEAPARVTLNPEAWAERQEERIAAVVVPAVDQAVTQAHHHAYRADRAEATVGVLSARVAQLEQATARLLQQKDHLEQERRELRTVVARYEQADVERARQADLPTVLERLGAERDPADPQQWRLEGERINVTGTKFYNHDRGRGGGGAIDLVQHATGYTFREAMAWLGAEVGRELAEKAGLEALGPDVQAAVREPRPAFQPPAPAEERWGQVRDYLVQERRLPAELVERVHAAGDVYASERGGHTNAVFLSRGPDGTPTGALVRGVEPDSAYRGLVAGSQRAAGVFAVDDPGAGERATWPARLIITEAPIDALSAYALRSMGDDRTPARIISTDGAGPVPHALIRQTLEGGGRVLVATDNDRAGEQLYERITEAHPEVVRHRPALKDLNDDLRYPERARAVREERAQAEAAERVRAAREAAGQADPVELWRIARLGGWEAPYAQAAYDAYRAARAAGLDERAAVRQAAVDLATRYDGMGASYLCRHLAQGLPRGGGRTEETAEREAHDAMREALGRADVQRYRAEHDRGRGR